ncbi:F-box/kelch-repeat protein At1g57790-like [Papaver somniferum]|uniref:F-box/kelch-repeat protein At1g57790-like n=1 Tax=Papaver somniferum TaxID=3469 RepID=UPI000E70306E|nr:F-box/kelch-repeat protein At1g57790-like [Papaver somniferum]
MHNNNYIIKVSDEFPLGATIRYSKDGWLLISTGKKTVFSYNPFTKAKIRLPDLPDDYVLRGMSFSTTPTSRNCVVIAVSNWCPWASDIGCGNAKISFLVCDLQKSSSGWNAHLFTYEYNIYDDFMPCINNPVFYNGAFYCLDYNGLLGVLDMRGDFCWKILSKSLRQFNSIYPSFLVECDKKLLLVNLGQNGKSTEIYSLDESEMAWVKLASLGKHAIFISYTSSFSVVAPRSYMENNVYFPRLYGERVLYYSLDTYRYHCVGSNQYSSQDFHNTKEISNCTWIEPNWSQASLCQEPE